MCIRDRYVGIEAAKRMAELLDPMELAGNVILIPLVNRGGFFDKMCIRDRQDILY